jgi:hypothetical protein
MTANELAEVVDKFCEQHDFAMDFDNEGQLIIYTGLYQE